MGLRSSRRDGSGIANQSLECGLPELFTWQPLRCKSLFPWGSVGPNRDPSSDCRPRGRDLAQEQAQVEGGVNATASRRTG